MSKRLGILIISSALSFTVSALSGCGGKVTKLSGSTNTQLVHFGDLGGNSGGGGSAGPLGPQPGTNSNNTANNAVGTMPLYSFNINGKGYTNTYKFYVQANKRLKIQFEPGLADRPVDGTGYYAQYSGLGVFIQVGSTEQATPLLDNGYQSGTVQRSRYLDFSTAFANDCGDDLACRKTVEITIKMPNNNYWCLNFGSYCSYTHVKDTHYWTGKLRVETDDTIVGQ